MSPITLQDAAMLTRAELAERIFSTGGFTYDASRWLATRVATVVELEIAEAVDVVTADEDQEPARPRALYEGEKRPTVEPS